VMSGAWPARSWRRFLAGRPRYTRGMCIICVEVAKKSMTVAEARRALGEMRTKLGDHITEVEAKLVEAEKADQQKP